MWGPEIGLEGGKTYTIIFSVLLMNRQTCRITKTEGGGNCSDTNSTIMIQFRRKRLTTENESHFVQKVLPDHDVTSTMFAQTRK